MNSTDGPRVSVIVPMRNAEAFIEQTLFCILSETSIALEVVVIDDLSTDRSREIVTGIHDNRIRVIVGSGTGIAAAMNSGLSAARGDIVMRCDADDLYPAGRIAEQLVWLDRNQDFVAVCGSFATIDSSGRAIVDLATGLAAEDITAELNLGHTRTCLCSYALRKIALERIGGFRQYFETAEDIDFQLRLGSAGRVMYLPRVYYRYRLHQTSITHTQANIKRIFFEKTARDFQSQRRATGMDDLQRGNPPAIPEAKNNRAGKASLQISGMLIGEAWRRHKNGDKIQAIWFGIRALAAAPQDFNLWRSVIALVVKKAR